MRKLFLLLFFGLTLLSCKKDQKCYHCIFGTFNGSTHPPVDYCGNDGGSRQFTDANGNELSSQCVEK
jgi:hypothetical protein